jgi:hypothetical protein
MKADAAARRDDVKAKVAQRGRELNAETADDDAAWAETDADYALDFAAWSVSNARLAVLDAIDARAYATEQAKRAASKRGPGTSSSS